MIDLDESTKLVESRWHLSGHILHRHEERPANKATQLYFHCMIAAQKKIQGGATLPLTINNDLSCTQDMLTKTNRGLNHLPSLAHSNDKWILFTKQLP